MRGRVSTLYKWFEMMIPTSRLHAARPKNRPGDAGEPGTPLDEKKEKQITSWSCHTELPRVSGRWRLKQGIKALLLSFLSPGAATLVECHGKS